MTSPATFDDVPAIRALLGGAYADDPLSRWLFPDDDGRPHACGAWYGLFAEQYVAGAHSTLVRSGDEIVAVALWRLPDDAPLSSGGVPGIAGLMTALLGRDRAGVVGAALHGVGALQGAGPQAYLNFLAVSAGTRRRGHGRRVLEPLFATARTAGLPVALETSDPANYAFYDALGFRETGRLQLDAGGPLVRALRRD
jgi:ribosomal protein S18 acetylase RimI-like enzyme